MGTRADFYIGRDPQHMEWLGSVAFDGDAGSMQNDGLFAVEGVNAYRSWVKSLDRDDFTSPEMGWPWPWETSATTDYAYTWDDGKVWWSCFGSAWETDPQADTDGALATAEFPEFDTTNHARAGTKRSGNMVISFGG